MSTRSASGTRTEPQRRGSSGIATCPAMSVSAARRRPLAGLGWEIGLLVFMGVLYAAGTLINPEFFGDFHALRSTLRDAALYGVLAVGMTFVIVTRDPSMSFGSALGLGGVVFPPTSP